MISILSRVGVSARRLQAAANAIVASGDAAANLAAAAQPGAAWRIVHDAHQIEHLLRYLLDSGQAVTLSGPDRQFSVRTRIVGIDGGADGHLLIECTADAAAHADLLRQGRVNLGSRFLELPIVCSVNIAAVVDACGKSCYRVALPQWVLFSEMRDSRRVQAPQTRAPRLVLDQPGRPRLEARVIDVSEDGIGLWLPQQTAYSSSVGEHWRAATLHDESGEPIVLDLEPRHVTRNGRDGYRLGALIHPASPADRQRLTRLIVRHEMLFAELGGA